jgi:hypothetical protein
MLSINYALSVCFVLRDLKLKWQFQQKQVKADNVRKILPDFQKNGENKYFEYIQLKPILSLLPLMSLIKTNATIRLQGDFVI